MNPSGEIARALHGTRLPDGTAIHGLVLPVAGAEAWDVLSRAIRRYAPCAILATGVSGRACASVEALAANENDYRIPDNAGRTLAGPVLRRGPATLSTSLDAAALARRLHTSALPVEPSHDAGRYVCNFLYYRLLHLTRRTDHAAAGRALFLHLPPSCGMARPDLPGRRLFPMDALTALVQHALTLLREA